VCHARAPNAAPTMSWLGKPGRPKEQGGHHRRNISVDSHTVDIILSVDNHSTFIEHSITEFTQPKWVDSEKNQIEIFSDSEKFVTVASFEFSPHLPSANALLEANCLFDYFSTDGPLACRVVVNGKKGLALRRVKNNCYTCSYMLETESGFQDMPALFHNQSHYTFCFQIRSVDSTPIYVKNMRFIVKYIEHPELENWNVYDTIWQIDDI
jgi:hypothetical protein